MSFSMKQKYSSIAFQTLFLQKLSFFSTGNPYDNLERDIDFRKTLIRRHYLILIFISFTYLEYFKERNFPERLWGITIMATFIEFRKDLLLQSKQKKYFLILVVQFNKNILLKLMLHFTKETNQNCDIKQPGKSSQILIEMKVLKVILFCCVSSNL